MGVGHNDFRGNKAFARAQGIAEKLVRQSQLHAAAAELILHHFALEAAAVDEFHGPAASLGLVGGPVREDHQRVELVGGHASAASDGLAVAADMTSCHAALESMPSGEGQKIELAGNKVQNGGLGLADIELFGAGVFQDHAAGDDIQFRKNAVEQGHSKSQGLVPENDLQGLGLFRRSINGGKAGQGIFTVSDGISRIAQVCPDGTGGAFHHKGGSAVVAGSHCGKLLGEHIQGIDALGGRLVGAGRESPVHILQKVIHFTDGMLSVVKMQQIVMAVRHHLIGRMGRMKREDSFLFVVLYSHNRILSK